jgi:16S rRNA (guanine966-N2)-methyltransferase
MVPNLNPRIPFWPAASIRIIAGAWRGRRIPVPASGVRPTGDRIRETLFNWLQNDVRGARCLDLFAGSGALGLEALSRGADRVVFVDNSAANLRQLKDTLAALDCHAAVLVEADAFGADLAARGPFDLVFLDPPFGTSDIANLCKLLEVPGVLADGASVYAEMSVATAIDELLPPWQLLKERSTGQVRYALLQFMATGAEPGQGEE